MRLITLLAAIASTTTALSACATRPPLPPECEGELTPINTPASQVVLALPASPIAAPSDAVPPP